jgi:hypothetical protein
MQTEEELYLLQSLSLYLYRGLNHECVLYEQTLALDVLAEFLSVVQWVCSFVSSTKILLKLA